MAERKGPPGLKALLADGRELKITRITLDGAEIIADGYHHYNLPVTPIPPTVVTPKSTLNPKIAAMNRARERKSSLSRHTRGKQKQSKTDFTAIRNQMGNPNANAQQIAHFISPVVRSPPKKEVKRKLKRAEMKIAGRDKKILKLERSNKTLTRDYHRFRDRMVTLQLDKRSLKTELENQKIASEKLVGEAEANAKGIIEKAQQLAKEAREQKSRTELMMTLQLDKVDREKEESAANCQTTIQQATIDLEAKLQKELMKHRSEMEAMADESEGKIMTEQQRRKDALREERQHSSKAKEEIKKEHNKAMEREQKSHAEALIELKNNFDREKKVSLIFSTQY